MCVLSFLIMFRVREKKREREGVNMTHVKALFFSSYLRNRQGKCYIGCYLHIGCCLLLRGLAQF